MMHQVRFDKIWVFVSHMCFQFANTHRLDITFSDTVIIQVDHRLMVQIKLGLPGEYRAHGCYTLPHGSLLKKNASCIANSVDVSTNPPTLCTPSSQPPSGPYSISLAPLLLKLAHLPVIFNLQLTHTASIVHKLKNK